MHVKYRHKHIYIYIYTSYYEIRYAVHNASALRQLGFYLQSYLLSNLFLLSDLLRIIQCFGLHRVRVVNMICRIRTEFPLFSHFHSFLYSSFLCTRVRCMSICH